MMTCTVAAIVSFLGYMPPRGTVIDIPRSRVNTYSVIQQDEAKQCAKKYGIVLRIDEAR